MAIQKHFKYLSFILCVFLFFCAKTDPTKQYDAAITEFATPAESLPFYKGKDLQPVWKSQFIEKENLRKINSFQMTDQLNASIGLSDMRNHLSIVSFFFTKCSGICPTITNQLKRVQDSFITDEEILIFSFSATPDLDTPEVMNSYAKERGINNLKWHLLTGNRDEIYKLARESFNADTITNGEKRKGRTNDDFLHSESVYLLDKNQNLRGIYNGKSSISIAELITDIKSLKQENY